MESGEKYGERVRPSRDRADRQRVAGRRARKGALQSGPYRWGNICGCRGTERTGNVPAGYRLGAVRGHHGTGVVGQCQRGVEDAAPYGGGSIRHKPKGFGRQGCSCGTDSPRGCPAIRPLRTGFLSVNKPQSSGRQGCACGRGVPRPSRWGNICGCRGTERTGNVPAGYRLGAVRGHSGTGVVGQCQRGVGDAGPDGGVCVRCQSAKFRAARMCRGPVISGPYGSGAVRCCHGAGKARQRAAGRIARKGALQSGPYG